MKIHTSKFEEVLAELEKAKHGWGLLGHNLSVSRVGVYEREMRKLIEMGPNGRGNLTNEEAGRVYLLLSEISEFLFASNVALARPHLAQATRIRDIFSGPDLASGELLSPSVVSRNTLFELTFAAAVEMAGMTADLSGVTDVKTEFQGVTISIECKRPQTMGKAESNIRRAAKQLAERNTNDTFGLVAICIGKVLTGGEKMLVAADKQSMTERLDGEAMDFLKNTMRF